MICFFLSLFSLAYSQRSPSTAIVRQLKCSNIRTCLRLGYRAFAAARPRVWNYLPVHICQPDDIRTVLPVTEAQFFLIETPAPSDCFRALTINILTYLLTRWCGSAMGRALDLRLAGREFKSCSRQRCVTT